MISFPFIFFNVFFIVPRPFWKSAPIEPVWKYSAYKKPRQHYNGCFIYYNAGCKLSDFRNRFF